MLLLVLELAELLNVLLMFAASPMLGECNSDLKFRDFIVESSRWFIESTCMQTMQDQSPPSRRKTSESSRHSTIEGWDMGLEAGCVVVQRQSVTLA